MRGQLHADRGGPRDDVVVQLGEQVDEVEAVADLARVSVRVRGQGLGLGFEVRGSRLEIRVSGVRGSDGIRNSKFETQRGQKTQGRMPSKGATPSRNQKT